MKEKKDNSFMQEIIVKDEGWANFNGYVLVNGVPEEKLVTAIVKGRGNIQYFDTETFELIDPKRIQQINGFTFATCKHIVEVIQLDIFFAKAEKNIDLDKNNKEKTYYYKKEVRKNDIYNI